MASLIILFVLGCIALLTSKRRETELSPIPLKISDKMGKLWEVAHQGMKENRLLRAEKALLTILNIDQKNAAAYNRLGILYAKQKEYKDAIDCFEIASSIEPSASSLHNLGLIYYETENYEKASTAFEQALKLEDQLAARYIAYAKANEKLGRNKIMLDALEKAVALEPSREALSLLYQAYIAENRLDDAKLVEARMKNAKHSDSPARRKVARPKRVVV